MFTSKTNDIAMAKSRKKKRKGKLKKNTQNKNLIILSKTNKTINKGISQKYNPSHKSY